MKCKSCGQDSTATLCNTCFLDEVIDAVERGVDNPSKIFQGMVTKYGRLKNLQTLSSYRSIFGPQKLRRVITTESGDKCKLVNSYDGWVAVSQEYPEEYQPGLPGILEIRPGQSAEGGRVITYYQGDAPVRVIKTPTSLVFRRSHSIKRTPFISSGPPKGLSRSPSLPREGT